MQGNPPHYIPRDYKSRLSRYSLSLDFCDQWIILSLLDCLEFNLLIFGVLTIRLGAVALESQRAIIPWWLEWILLIVRGQSSSLWPFSRLQFLFSKNFVPNCSDTRQRARQDIIERFRFLLFFGNLSLPTIAYVCQLYYYLLSPPPFPGENYGPFNLWTEMLSSLPIWFGRSDV